MDRALKERIIGAIVLVVFVVLVVPIFLDGPPAESELVSEQVRLPGQGEQQSKTVVLDRERSVPIPAARNVADADQGADTAPDQLPADPPAEPAVAEAESTGGEPSAPAQQPATREPAPVVAASPPQQTASESAADTSSTGMWAVQLGSFKSRENAEGLAASLRKEGYAAFLSQRETADGQMHRVRIGPQADRDAAEKTAARLAREGHAGQVVPHP